MLFNTRGNGENIRVKDDVFRRKTYIFGQNFVRTRAYFNFAFITVRLAFFIERHHDGCSTVATAELGVLDEFRNAFFHRDGIDDCLALHAFQACFDHAPL